MSIEIRRVVTEHDRKGRARIGSDERLRSRSPVDGYDGVEIFESDVPRTRIRIVELAPGHRSPFHRTQTVDYAILLSGSCDLLVDGDERVTLGAGDVVVQRGTNHAWHVLGATPARFAFVLIDV